MQNMKKPIGNTSFFVFFTTLNLIRDVKAISNSYLKPLHILYHQMEFLNDRNSEWSPLTL